MSLDGSELAATGCTHNPVPNSPLSASMSPSNERVDVTEMGVDYHGDQLKDKKKGILRIGFININSLSPRKGTAKYDSIKNSLLASEMDIIGIAEPNKCWHLMQASDTWKETQTYSSPQIKGHRNLRGHQFYGTMH